MNITPEMIASLSPELQQEMQRRLFALLDELGVKPMITPEGDRVFIMAELATALGLSLGEAMVIADQFRPRLTIDPATLVRLH